MKILNYVLIYCFLISCAFGYDSDKLYKLTILHTNDHHGRFWPNKDGESGLAARATLIKKIRTEVQAEGGHVLLLDAGDINTGTPISDMLDAEPDFKGMALLQYDVMAVGNHEFDNPLSTIAKQRKWAGFPFISANIYDKKTSQRIFPSHIKKDLDGLKITIFGLTTEDTPLKTNPKNVESLLFVPAVEEAKKLVPTIKGQSDILIALTHMGHYPDGKHGADAPGDVTLARSVPGIDVIVGGHTQKPLFQPDIQNGTIIVQAHEWGKYLGRVDLEFINGKVNLKNYALIPVNLKDSQVTIEQDVEVKEFLTPFKKLGDESLSIKIADSEVEFIGRREIVRFQETNLGNLVAAAYKKKFNADIAIVNAGGIRDSIYPGDVTYETVLMVLPFGGEIVTTKIKGENLESYLKHIFFELNPGSGSFPHLAGVEATLDYSNKSILSLSINGKSLNPSSEYLITLPEFVANGGDKYPKVEFTKYGYTDADILKEFIQSLGSLKANDFAPTQYLKKAAENN